MARRGDGIYQRGRTWWLDFYATFVGKERSFPASARAKVLPFRPIGGRRD